MTPQEWARLFGSHYRDVTVLGARTASNGSTACHGAAFRIIEEILRPFRLTPSERSVAMRVLLGESTIAIAHARNCAPATVKVHLRHIYQKADVADRAEFAALVLFGVIHQAIQERER